LFDAFADGGDLLDATGVGHDLVAVVLLFKGAVLHGVCKLSGGGGLARFEEIQDPLDLQGPDDPPHEGMHTFRNARERMRRREGEVGWWYVFGWYLYHVMTLWTLPFRLTEWEIGRVKRMHRQDIPEAMRAWSQSLPPEQWAKPSEELQRQSRQVEVLRQRDPQRLIVDIFAEVQRSPEARARA
jgi:hypothetical protein